MLEDLEFNMKVIVVGNGKIGKTSLTQRFAKGIFSDQYKKTLGVAFLEKLLYVDSLGIRNKIKNIILYKRT